MKWQEKTAIPVCESQVNVGWDKSDLISQLSLPSSFLSVHLPLPVFLKSPSHLSDAYLCGAPNFNFTVQQEIWFAASA